MIKDHLAKLLNLFTPKAAAERKLKPWQEDEPWCTPYRETGRVLWNVETRGEAYCRKKHGALV